jgi:hypothetical protein
MSFLVQPIQVLASSGNGIDAEPSDELSAYATLLNDRGPQATVVTGDALVDLIALHTQFLLKLRGSNGLEGLVTTNPYAPGHIIDPTNPRKWYETGGKVGLIYNVAGKGFLGIRTA